jgi:hypothetical protein
MGRGRQQPFTAYGTLFKKLVIEDLDDEGHILRRRKGVTTVLLRPPTVPHPYRSTRRPKSTYAGASTVDGLYLSPRRRRMLCTCREPVVACVCVATLRGGVGCRWRAFPRCRRRRRHRSSKGCPPASK